MTGVCKFWVYSSGWGYLIQDEPGPEIFCHVRCLRGEAKELQPGERVSFEISTDGPRGLLAVNVRRVQQTERVT